MKDIPWVRWNVVTVPVYVKKDYQARSTSTTLANIFSPRMLRGQPKTNLNKSSQKISQYAKNETQLRLTPTKVFNETNFRRLTQI